MSSSCPSWLPLVLVALLGLLALPGQAEEVEVFQNLDEATRRIARQADKPIDQLVDADGFYQSETLIFTDIQTGHEVWSLTMEHATDLANIERRNVFSADGSMMSMKGNRAFRELNGEIYKTQWAGHNFLINADLTQRRKFWVNLDGKPTMFKAKFDTWSRVTPRRLYYVIDDKLYRVDLGEGLHDNTATLLYTFPNDKPKTLQNISDNDILLVQDVNGDVPSDAPLFYAIDAKRDPSDPLFVRFRSFNYGGLEGIDGHDPQNEFHVHVITVNREGTHVGWNYGSATEVGEYVHFSLPLDDFDAKPTYRSAKVDPWGQYISHPGKGQNDRLAYFSGPIKQDDGSGNEVKIGNWGIWVRGGELENPVYIGGPVSGGHASWNSFDPDWFVANPNLGWPDKPLSGTIIAGRADPSGDMAGAGSTLRVLAHAWDHRRGGNAGFDALPRPSQSPDATKAWFHSSMLMPDDSFTGSYIVVARRPYAPAALTISDGVLRWTPHTLSHEVKQWLVYHEGADGWNLIASLPKNVTNYRKTGDGDPMPGRYMVTALEWSGLESDLSSPVVEWPTGTAVDAVEAWDTKAPAAPANLNAEATDDGHFRLTWAPPAANDLRHFHLYCLTSDNAEVSQASRFASPPASSEAFLDWAPPPGSVHRYAITAVDRQGNESKPIVAEAGK